MTDKPASQLISLPRTSFYRTNTDWKIKDTLVIEAIYAELELSPRSGFWKCFCRLSLNPKRRVKKTA